MTARCVVCQSPFRETADAGLRAGKSPNSMAGVTGLDRQSLGRHKRNGHIRPDPVTVASESTIAGPSVGPSAAASEHLRGLVEGYAATDTSEMSPQQLANHREGYRRASESLARAEGRQPLEESELRAEYDELYGASVTIATVLERFPEAKAAVGVALTARREARQAA